MHIPLSRFFFLTISIKSEIHLLKLKMNSAYFILTLLPKFVYKLKTIKYGRVFSELSSKLWKHFIFSLKLKIQYRGSAFQFFTERSSLQLHRFVLCVRPAAQVDGAFYWPHSMNAGTYSLVTKCKTI